MRPRKLIRLAIQALRHYRQEYYGWSAKFHEEDRKKYAEYSEAISYLENLLKALEGMK